MLRLKVLIDCFIIILTFLLHERELSSIRAWTKYVELPAYLAEKSIGYIVFNYQKYPFDYMIHVEVEVFYDNF